MAREKAGQDGAEARFLLAAVAVGLASGLACVALSLIAGAADEAHRSMPQTAVLLPLFAAATVLLYRVLDLPPDIATVTVVDESRKGRFVSWKIAPAILLGTAATLVGGGSVGKEAAALQMGAGISSGLSRFVGTGEDKVRIFALCGMAAAFSALMFAPIAAALFVFEVVRPRVRGSRWLLACIPVSSMVAYAVAAVFGVGRLWVAPVAPPQLEEALFEAVLASVLCAFVGLAFVLALKLVRTVWSALFRDPLVRVVVGSVLVAVVLALPGASVGSGLGAGSIEAALSGAEVGGADFAWKFALTVLCLGVGLKGGEIMPVFCIGACLGSTLGVVTGSSPAFLAELGLIALFSACSCCPAASFALGIEAFGIAGAPYFALAALVGLLAGRTMSLYDTSTWDLRAYGGVLDRGEGLLRMPDRSKKDGRSAVPKRFSE